jgi:hypothetical protein
MRLFAAREATELTEYRGLRLFLNWNSERCAIRRELLNQNTCIDQDYSEREKSLNAPRIYSIQSRKRSPGRFRVS